MHISNILHINFPDFDDYISKGLTVIDFWAVWCQPCKIQDKYIEEHSKAFSDIQFGKVNADDNRFLVKKYGIQTIPTILFFKDGKVIKRLVGIQSSQIIKNELIKFKSYY